MRTGFAILYLIFSSVMVAQSVHLTVPAVDSSDNAVTIGMAYFTWGQFTGNNGVIVQAGQLTRPVTNGTIDVTLAASDNAGYVYTLLLMHGSTADTFKWRIPATGATTMAQLNQPPAGDAVSATTVRTDQANTYTAGKKQVFAASATTAGEGFSGASSDPSAAVAGDLWFRTDIHHMRIYDGSTGQTLMYGSDTLPANQLANPATAVSLLFAANPFNVTFGSATGAANMMTVQDTANNTGTGYILTAATASGSTASPFQVRSAGAQNVYIDSTGKMLWGTDNTYDQGTSSANRVRSYYAGTSFAVASSGLFRFVNRSQISASGIGNILLSRDGVATFNLLQFACTASSCPALKISGTTIAARLADDSAYAPVEMGVPKFGGANTTGATAFTPGGSNCPAVSCTTPYTWIRVVTADGSTAYLPVYK
jgi:hypothetical protein